MKIEEFIDSSNSIMSVDVLFKLYETAMMDEGIDRVIFSLMTDHIMLSKKAGHGIIVNYPDDWMKYYVEQNYESIDSVRYFMFASKTPFTWKNITENFNQTKKQKIFFNEAEEAGLFDGIGVPLRSTHGAIAGFGLASSTKNLDLDKNTLSHINLISQQFYTTYISLEKTSEEVTLPDLTEREKEVLKWCGHGKTKWEISQILNISQHTVDFHTRNAFKKLEVFNVTVAVLKALNMGIIQL